MGKKRKASRRDAEPAGPKALDPADARLGPISSYADVANSEDEYFLNRENILLDDEPESKRRRKDNKDIELSDEEIFGYQESDSDDATQFSSSNKKQISSKDDGSSDQETEAHNQQDEGWWGDSRREYYDADNIETEADALEEEAEAKRLQKKKLSKMREEDFVFDGDAWLASEPGPENEKETTLEVLNEIEVSDDMNSQERLKLLVARYPEFEHLVVEMQNLLPMLEVVKSEAVARPSTSLHVVKYWTLGCYVAALASYFAIMTSPARDDEKTSRPMAPSELRDHGVMEALVKCRNAWQRVKEAKPLTSPADISLPGADSLGDAGIVSDSAVDKSAKMKLSKDSNTATAKQAKKLAKAKAIEASVLDLYNIPSLAASKSKRQGKSSLQARQNLDNNSDFGEEEGLDVRTAAEKAARKKSLKFYTSQIVQKASRRAGAGRDAGGDADIPYRERFRDKQARLLAEAKKRGSKESKHGADLGGESDDDDAKAATAVRNDVDEYLQKVLQAAKTKRENKQARYAAYAAASKTDRVVEKEEIGEDGKRKITYAIEKNKGLAPRRSKDVRNPRVKRRKQFEAKQKKLKSMKPVWQGGEPKGGYHGELSGINTAVVKSTKL
ncbi:hypothetical protein CDD81_6767 [Ophiocordyceps australis]|uniref:Sas10 C-terminal domain-containing protein n=1 Tax=Ophiocordyceps australis TaxID=1399860 RepID=A0A2C5XHD9_9HYPO|nr:hypothetical protein CDD81_6767 [Ophiocordyceps australis]